VESFALEQREIGDGRCEIIVRGELDLAVAERLEEAIAAAARDHAGIVVGLAECEFIDSTGIAVIVRAHQRLGDQERHLVACCPQDQVERVLDITGLLENGLVYGSLDEAIAAIRAATEHDSGVPDL
jgi:anti-sigma B factor antagonist